ncbi:transcriptional regulator, IclR family [Geodermatophilus sabuli]|uniref:Transcriptional regulator, IclR family n=1 Tax=Geodermatophilus sabuli TaxID=1564158 RepID=A0A285E6X8_9ACTN|nr:transcriptional regulator, IclR family [Geodermatophilus sabuli]
MGRLGTLRAVRRGRTAAISSSRPGGPAHESPSILSKAFEVLRAFNSAERVMTLSELARAADLPKSTVHRLLARLVELDAVEHHGDGYKISLGMAQLGAVTPASIMRDLALPHLARLHHWTGASVSLGVLRRFDVVLLEQVARPEWHHRLTRVGARLPANCTALGKALLAWEDLDDLADFLPRPMPVLTPSSIRDVDRLVEQLRGVREQNLARERNETLQGVAGVATSIVINGVAVGALAVLHPVSTPLPPQADTALRDTAGRLGREIQATLREEGRARWFPGTDRRPSDGSPARGPSALT